MTIITHSMDQGKERRSQVTNRQRQWGKDKKLVLEEIKYWSQMMTVTDLGINKRLCLPSRHYFSTLVCIERVNHNLSGIWIDGSWCFRIIVVNIAWTLKRSIQSGWRVRFVETGHALTWCQVICDSITETRPETTRIQWTSNLRRPIVVGWATWIESGCFLEWRMQKSIQLTSEPVLNINSGMPFPLPPLGPAILEPDLNSHWEREREY